MKPLFQQARERVLDGIRSGEFPVGTTLPSCEELSERSGCSPGTVQRALAELAHEGLIDRVRHRGTVVLRQPVTKRVCLMLALDVHLNLILQDVVYSTLSANGFHVEVVPMTGDAAANAAHCRTLRSGPTPTEHLVVLNPLPAIKHGSLLFETTQLFPHRVDFSLDRSGLESCRLVCIDHLHSASQVVSHLLGLGHRRIAVLAGHDPSDKSYAADASRACGHLLSIAGAAYFPHYMTQDWLGGLVKRIVDERITACWALHDNHAMNLVGLCQRNGLRVPEDVSIIGRFDTPWSVQCHPRLTSVSMNPAGIARAIVAELNASSAGAAKHIANPPLQVETILMARESSGPAPNRP